MVLSQDMVLQAFWPPPKPPFEPGCLRHLQKQLSHQPRAPPLPTAICHRSCPVPITHYTHGTPGRRLQMPPLVEEERWLREVLPTRSCPGRGGEGSSAALGGPRLVTPCGQGASLLPPTPSPSLPAEPHAGIQAGPVGSGARSPRTGRPRHSPAGVPGYPV